MNAISGSWGILLAYTRLNPIGPITHNCAYNIFHTSYFALATFLTHKNVISIKFLSLKNTLKGPTTTHSGFDREQHWAP